MACSVTLRDRLILEAAGGAWTYNGYEASYDGNKDNLAQFGSGGGGGTYTFPSPGGTVTGGDNPTINFSGADAGAYSFTYTKGTHAVNIVVYVEDTPCAGTSTDYWTCEDPAGSVDVTDILEINGCSPITTGGQWIYNTGYFNPTTAIFSPFEAGTYPITYKVEPPATFGQVPCLDCLKEATVRVNVLPSTTTETCSYWQILYPGIDQTGLDTYTVSSVIFNETQYVSSPLGLGTKSTSVLEGNKLVLNNFVNVLNTLPLPVLVSSASTNVRECDPYSTGISAIEAVELMNGGDLGVTFTSVAVQNSGGSSVLDVVASVSEDSNLRRRISLGGGDFASVTSVVGTIPGGVLSATGDVTGNGVSDLIVLDDSENIIYFYQNFLIGYNYFKISRRPTDTFEIIMKQSGVNFARWTETAMYIWDAGVWKKPSLTTLGQTYVCNEGREGCATTVGCGG